MLLGGQNDLNKSRMSSSISGNEMPGYPRVSSVVPQHSLNCNGYSGEFSGAQQNAGQQQSQQNQNTSQQQQQQQQQQQHQQQSQSIQHGMHWKTDTNGVHWKAQTNGTRQPISDGLGSWKSQTNGVPSAQQQQQMPGLDANNKTGHFLSYSHHLRDLNTDGSLTSNSNTDMCLSSVQPNLNVEPTNGGGGVLPHWKSEAKPPDDFQSPQQQQGSDINSKNKSSPKLDSEKPVKKPAPKRQRKKPNASTQSQPPTKQTIDEKKSSSFMPNFNKGNDLYPPNAYGANTKYENSSPSYMPGVHTAPDPLNPYQPPDGFDAITAAKPPSANNFLYGSLGSKPLKQEPLSSIPPPRQPYPVPGSATNYPSAQVKMEGYERNYQNFINYADYCQSQNNSGSSTVSASGAHQTEYGQNYGNYPPYSSSAYHPHPHHQAYPNSPYNSTGVPNFSSIPSAETNCNNNQQSMSTTETQDIKPYMRDTDKETDTKNSDLTKLTNYEKDIPIHTYPNHGRFTDSTNSGHHTADGIKNHKIDDVSKSSNERFSFYEENGINANQEHQPMQQQQPQPQPFNGISYYPQKQGSTLNKDHLNNDKLSTDDMDLDKSYTSADLNQLPIDRTEKGMKPEVPDCDCFAPEEKSPPEPGSYYTHLGSASTLAELRTNMENRIGIRGRQLRIEKVIYSGKEGKTSQGCPLAKWIIRRVDSEEKILCIVKRRQGHKCNATFIVVCIVAWEGVPKHEADNSYRLLIHKLNKFGLPTTRRCATNENRTCACQGLDPETSGASFSFGCSWSMYYNGCKYARSKTVRKFRLSVKSEEPEIEEHMNVLATMLSPLYKTLAPKAYENQCKYESEAPDCRLGLKAGKPFSGVTTCMDFCAHAHRDLHNMQDGCTVQVGLLKPKSPGMPSDDEQLHILPLYVMDTTDEFDSGDAQKEKHKNGAVQVLEKFPCEVRVRATPLLPCRRHGKKRNGKDMPDDEETGTPTEETAPLTPAATPAPPTPTTVKKEGGKKGSKSQSKQQAQSPSHPLSRAETPSTANAISNLNIGSNSSNTSGSPSNHSAFSAPNQTTMMNSNSNLINMASMIDNFTDAQLQSNQISSTVLDSPYSYDYATGSYIDKRNYYNQQWIPPHAMETYGYPPADRNEQVKSRGSEENPDSTTIINANNSGSAFSPSVVDVTKMQRQQPQDYPTYGYHHHTTQPAYPMYPTYSTPSYNQTHHYNNLDYYNNDKLRYNFYTPHHPHHQPYNPYDIYHHASVGQIPQTQTPPPNWNLFSPAAPSAVPVATPHITTPPLSNSQSNNSTEPTLTNLSGLSEHMSPTAVSTPQPTIEKPTEDPIPQKPEPIGEITEINDNLDCFQDTQLGGIGIALEHGSVLIECAKHEMHATSSLKRPNRKNPTRITLIFYQHRNLNRHRHGIEEWEEKMRLKRLGITLPPVDEQKIEAPATKGSNKSGKSKPKPRKSRSKSDSKKEKIEKTPEIAAVIKEESNKFS
ncbi:DNA N6-methyl adenine demethylase-like isoform X2 [Contarinia nasturtii]|uniref:DNA N6-methyl adenine demethylase-like isoform X2 n=1 Tax=Contarinia nasturtii TaxID=265458 RepID=UPI0012D3D428|nr:DNA N6-methyl adenine demethylase-like isoform X2 [Contarinia nasturtii]